MFLNHLYGGMDEPELKIIDVFVCKLRKKLAQATGGDNYIETVWGRGYVLRDPQEDAMPPQKVQAAADASLRQLKFIGDEKPAAEASAAGFSLWDASLRGPQARRACSPTAQRARLPARLPAD